MSTEGIGVGLVLAGAGAILHWALAVDYWHSLNLNVTGDILMVVGALAVLLSLYLGWRETD